MSAQTLKVKTETDITEDHLRLEKCEFLLQCIESSKVDPARTMPGSETAYQLSFDEAEILRFKGKLFELIKQF
jgi:hypothetical protein